MQAVGIVLMCIVAAVMYGIAHDQITARVCVEYFTVGHPPVFGTTDPTLLGLGWGIIATWWVGLLLGVPLALVSRVGSRPKRSLGSLIRPVAFLLGVMAGCASIAGVIGWHLAQTGAVFLVGPIAAAVTGGSQCAVPRGPVGAFGQLPRRVRRGRGRRRPRPGFSKPNLTRHSLDPWSLNDARRA